MGPVDDGGRTAGHVRRTGILPRGAQEPWVLPPDLNDPKAQCAESLQKGFGLGRSGGPPLRSLGAAEEQHHPPRGGRRGTRGEHARDGLRDAVAPIDLDRRARVAGQTRGRDAVQDAQPAKRPGRRRGRSDLHPRQLHCHANHDESGEHAAGDAHRSLENEPFALHFPPPFVGRRELQMGWSGPSRELRAERGLQNGRKVPDGITGMCA